jgi:hypothetical protein
MIWGTEQQDSPSEYFFWDLMRKYVVVFGRTFQGISIQRMANTQSNNVTAAIVVPIRYAAKDKEIVRLEQDPDLDRPFSTLLPALSFEIAPPGLAYDPDRKLPYLNKNVAYNSANVNTFNVQYIPAPYHLYFNLNVYVKNQNDGMQIIEQILPFFQPDWTPKLELIPSMGVTMDVPIEIMPGFNYNDLYDKEFTTRRMITYTIPFRMKVNFWGPVRAKPIIKFVSMNMRAGKSTNNQVTMNYSNASGNLGSIQVGTSVYAYANNGAVLGSGVITNVSLANNTAGTIRAEVLSGNLQGPANNVYVSTNTAQFTTLPSNGFTYGIWNQEGQFLATPAIAETVQWQATLSANGQPTSIANSVPWDVINVNDDYGFASEVLAGQIP